MLVGWIAASAEMTRMTRSFLISSVVFVPILLRSDWRTALAHSVPIAFICMIGYLINDLHDVEKDRENHPSRALPRGALPAPAAATLFFALLAACLLIVKVAISAELAFLYLVGLLAIINYNYVVSYLWPLKNVYVGAVATMPLFIIWRITTPALPLMAVALPLFMLVTGTEMLSDVKDHKGDGNTPAKALGLRSATRLAFAGKLCGGIVLLVAASSNSTVMAALSIIVLELLFIKLWSSGVDRNWLTRLMPAQVAIGMAFVL